MPRVVIDPALPDRASLDNEIARLRGLDVGQLQPTSWVTSMQAASVCSTGSGQDLWTRRTGLWLTSTSPGPS